MFAAAASQRAPGERHLAVLAFKRCEALVAAVVWINVDNDQPGAFNSEIGLRCPLPPEFDLPSLCRGIEQPPRHKQAVGMFRGFAARRPATELAAARTDCSAAMLNWPIRWETAEAAFRDGERSGKGGLGHDPPPAFFRRMMSMTSDLSS